MKSHTTTAVKRMDTRRMVSSALLSAMAAVLMYLDAGIPIFPFFLKMDLSDLPPLIGAFLWGPGAGVAVEAVKNVLHAMTTSSAGIGEAANFVMGSALVLCAGAVYRRDRTKRGALRAMALGTIAMATTAALVNTFALLPFYSRIMPMDRIIALSSSVVTAIHDVPSLVLYGIVPFNLAKGALVSTITFFLYKRVENIL